MITDFMLVEDIEERLFLTRLSDRVQERSEVVSVEGSLAGLFGSPSEVILRVVAFMTFFDLLSLRHASATFFRFSSQWEVPIVASLLDTFLGSCGLLKADKLFRTLTLNGPATFDYLLRLRRRDTNAGILAKSLAKQQIPKQQIPESYVASAFPYRWLDIMGDNPVASLRATPNADKLKRCLLLHNHFFESLHAGLANYVVAGKQETQLRPEVSAFLQVEAAILGRYTANAIDRLLGIHEWLLTAMASKFRNAPSHILANPKEGYSHRFQGVNPLLLGGHPALEDAFKFDPDYRLKLLYARMHRSTASSAETLGHYVPILRQVLPPLELEISKKVSAMLPARYVRNLGLGWTPLVDIDKAFEHFADYVLSNVDNDDEMLAQDTSATHWDASASPWFSSCVASGSSTSTAVIPIAHPTHRLRRGNRPCPLKWIDRH